MIAHEVGEAFTLDEVVATLLVLQHEHPEATFGIEAAVADEVEDVVLPAPKPALQLAERGRLEPFELDLARLDQPGE